MQITTITSRQNRIVRQAAALGTSPDSRRQEGKFLCEGARLCEDAVRSGVPVLSCFFTQKAKQKYERYLKELLESGTELYEVQEHVAQLLSSTKTSQGIFCVCQTPSTLMEECAPKASLYPVCLVLEQLQDPGNLGTILRTAEALGIQSVCLVGECCDVLSPKAVRSSMGAVFRVHMHFFRRSEQCAEALKTEGYTQLAAVPDRTAAPVTAVDFSASPTAVWVGNEGNGLSQSAIELCDCTVTIPMGGRAESLNASAAATILLWEMAQGGGAGLG